MKSVLALLTFAFLLTSCEKYNDYDNMEVTENNFTGTISVSESAGDVDGEFMGSGDSGAYGFIWDNPSNGAVLDAEVFDDDGTVQIILEDSRGDEVLNASVAGPENVFSIEGNKGKWKVRIIFLEFDGDGSFDLNTIQ